MSRTVKTHGGGTAAEWATLAEEAGADAREWKRRYRDACTALRDCVGALLAARDALDRNVGDDPDSVDVTCYDDIDDASERALAVLSGRVLS